MKKYFFLFSLIATTSLDALAEPRGKLDSMLKQLPHLVDGVDKMLLLRAIANNYAYLNADTTKVYIQAIMDIAARTKSAKGMYYAYTSYANLYMIQSLDDSALYYLKKTETLQLAHPDSFSRAALVFVQSTIGNAFYTRSKYANAMAYLGNAEKIIRDVPEKEKNDADYYNSYLINNSLASMAIVLHDSIKAKMHTNALMPIANRLRNPSMIGNAYFMQERYLGNFGRNAALRLELLDSAVHYYTMNNDILGLRSSLIKKSVSNREIGNITAAVAAAKTALVYARQTGDTSSMTSAVSELCQSALAQKNGSLLREQLVLLESLLVGVHDSTQIDHFGPLIEAYSYLGDYERALKYQQLFHKRYAAKYDQDQINTKNELETKFETAEKERIISEQRLAIQTQQLQNLNLEKQMQLSALKAEYDKKQALAKTEEERQKLRFEADAKRRQIEHDFNSKQAALNADRQRNDLIAKSEKQQQAEALKIARLEKRQQFFYGLAALMTLLGAGIWYYLFSRHRRQKLQNELGQEHAALLLKEATYKAKLNHVSFAALRSQMNPHFIFNCLNSIKLYTEQNNSEAASQYLSKFASLIRNTLDNARMEKILLHDEIASLELYLQMEAMRFKEKLTYKIDVDENVDTEFIEIPPMLLQPYVENAIWHGLMHKKDGGEIRIHFAQVQNNSLLVITVQDNGIGRTRAGELRSKSAETHKSYGTKITSERIALINEAYGADADINIADLKDKFAEATGTLVTIKLPIK